MIESEIEALRRAVVNVNIGRVRVERVRPSRWFVTVFMSNGIGLPGGSHPHSCRTGSTFKVVRNRIHIERVPPSRRFVTTFMVERVRPSRWFASTFISVVIDMQGGSHPRSCGPLTFENRTVSAFMRLNSRRMNDTPLSDQS
jgi:hypothetical protein